MVKIKKKLVSNAIQRRMTYGGKNPVRYIMVHQTANTSKGADALAHANLQANGNSRQASWHYQVDAKNIYQSFPDTAQTWHAGNRYYNENSIGIELTVNSDGDYVGTVENGAKLVKYLMDKYNVPISRVIRHKDASGKYCPRELLNGKDGITWNKFKQMVQGADTPSKPKPSKPKPTPTPSKKSTATIAKEVIAGKWGNGADRKNRLEKAGYNFTTIQREVNKQLGAGGTSKPNPKQKTTDQLAKEVIDGKHGTGNARKKSLGNRYSAVQARVNQMLGAGGSTSKPKPKPTKKSNKQIALEIYRGQGNWGTGKTRQDRLRKAGYNPSAVQREVNKLFK